VEVRAGGISYRGILIEVTQTEVTLRGKTGFISIPMDRVTSIRDPKEPMAKSGARFIDSSFYSADQISAYEPAPNPAPSDDKPDKKES